MEGLFEEKHEEWIAKIASNPRNLASEQELQEQAKVALRRFLEADVDGSQSLSFQELKRLCDEMGLPMGEDEEEALARMDTDGNGTLDIEEWVLWWLKRISTLPNPIKQQEAIARNTFAKFDIDQSGYLNAAELGSLLTTLGADFTDEEVEMALDEIDTDRTGSVEVSEFIAWWTNRASSTRSSSSLISLKLRKLAAKAMKQFYTDIFTAAWKGDTALVKSFLESEPLLAQASDDSDFGEQWTALQYASYRGHLPIVQLLLEAGASVNATNQLGFTALFYAAQQGHSAICEELSARGADPSVVGCHPDADHLFLCPADFMDLYPALRPLFASHRKMVAPEAIASSDVLQCSLSAGQLTLEVANRRSGTQALPVKAFRCTLHATPCEALAAVVDPVTTKIAVSCKKPGSSSGALSMSLPEDWWQAVRSGYYLHKMETLRANVFTPEAVQELWQALSTYYNAMDLWKRKAMNLEDRLLAAIQRGVLEAQDVAAATKEAEALCASFQRHLQSARETAGKAANVQALVTQAVRSMTTSLPPSGKAPEKRAGSSTAKAERKAENKAESKGSGGAAADAKRDHRLENKAVTAKEESVEAGVAAAVVQEPTAMPSSNRPVSVTTSNRAPWAVTLTLAPVNAVGEGPATVNIPVKVAYLKV